MTWVRIPDEWADSLDVERIGPLAAFMHIAALSWSNRAGADGFISTSRAKRLLTLDETEALIGRLVNAGVWERVNGGYQITQDRGLLRFQFTREQEEDYRAKKAAAGRASAEARARTRVETGVEASVQPTTSTSTSTSRSSPTSSLRSSESAQARMSDSEKNASATAPTKTTTRRSSFRDGIPGEDPATLRAKYGDESKWENHAGG